MPRPPGLRAIDLLIELPTGGGGMGLREARRQLRDAESATYDSHPAQYLFKDAGTRMSETWTWDELVELMDQHGIERAQIAVDPRAPEHAIELFTRFPGRFFGEVGVDPNRGMEAVRALERTVRAHPDVRSASLAPCLLDPQVPIGDKRCYPIYAKCIELGIPINILTGVPGPRVPMACQDPYQLDELCWFFPELVIVMRHGAEPWVDLAVKLLLKWPNLYYSTTAFAPKHYPRAIIDFANTRGADKVMWSGYFPGLSYDRVFRELDELPLRDHVWEPFLAGNARRVFGLDDVVGGAAPTGTPA